MTTMTTRTNSDKPSRRRSAVSARIEAIKRFAADFMRRGAFRSELAKLDRHGKLDTILEDIGITRAELNIMARGYPEADRLLPTMAYRLGIALDEIDAHSLHALKHTCVLCQSHRKCRRWLASGRREGAERFCPNHPLLERLRGHQVG